jgi:hypothetical protein
VHAARGALVDCGPRTILGLTHSPGGSFDWLIGSR